MQLRNRKIINNSNKMPTATATPAHLKKRQQDWTVYEPEDDLCEMMERLELEKKAGAPLRYTPADIALKAVLDSLI